ncbi:uncharacterized protein LOC109828557, partial [Asparagus officinalis]|uniref:uncharacterized protein LOC109828557 n=1 Tax=Asparagus officinalis TaxID=4686 RepID=UPI00098E53E3
MARDGLRKMNRGSRTSQMVSEQQEIEAGADDFLNDQEEADAEEVTTDERFTRLEDAVMQISSSRQQQDDNIQKLSAQMGEFSSKMEFMMQEIKNLKNPDQRVLGTGTRGNRDNSLSAAGESSKSGHGTGYLPPHRRVAEFMGEFPPVYSFGNSSTQRNSFFSNQKLVQPKSLRLDFPSFSGSENVIAWLEQTEQIFEYYEIKEDEWVKVCSFYLRDEALQWYRWLTKNLEDYYYWAVFKEEIITRFGPSELTRPYDAFSTMRQTSTVREYLGKFEQALGLLDDQPSKRHILERFIGGLKDELRYDVSAARPTSLKGAVALAKLFEDKQKNERKNKGHWSFSNSEGSSMNKSQNPSLKSSDPQAVKPFPQFKRMTSEEIQKKRSQNLCFTCDEKWHRGHQCKGKQLFILEGIMGSELDRTEEAFGEEEEENSKVMELAESLVRGSPSISVQALNGITASHTIRVVGYYKNQAINILIDSGSTHNFINTKLVKKLGITVTESSNFEVLVASGELIKGGGVCPGVSLDCQGVNIQVDLLVMPMGGSQVVLGADWMRTLDDITLNFNKLQVTFMTEGVKKTLQGVLPDDLQLVDSKQIAKTLREQEQGFFIQLCSMGLQSCTTEGTQGDLPTEVQELIQEFGDVFQELPHLPPRRDIDHRIPLEDGTKPICIRPYRHAHFLKDEIEKQVEDMLNKGIIRPSNSPFSSPVVMVKKSDGGWRMCIDYRSLNQATIKDKFPIPVIDELLDELHGAKFFTKLDLKSGYHQIRMHAADIPKTAFRTHSGHFEFLVMPFGLTNAPSTFQALMNSIFKDLLRKSILVFFDDILIYSAKWQDHLFHLKQ